MTIDQAFPPYPLNEKFLLEGISYLTKIDPDLSKIVADLGFPPLWSREPGFPTLIHIILEQQVSLASARAAFVKLKGSVGQLTPESFLGLTDGELRRIGFSRQKTLYCRQLSNAILNGELNLEGLRDLGDSSVRAELMKIKGIGPWTADIYLLMALLSPDIWPSGDLALAKVVQDIKRLSSTPSPDLLLEIAEKWKPWRAVAARILWHYYLS